MADAIDPNPPSTDADPDGQQRETVELDARRWNVASNVRGTDLRNGSEVVSETLFDRDGIKISRELTRRIGNDSKGPQRDQIVVTTGAGDDKVEVLGQEDGKLSVGINGRKFEIALTENETKVEGKPWENRLVQEFAVRSGDGNDTIVARPDVRANMDVDAGAGNDTVVTGAGFDRVKGGSGDDAITTGDNPDYVDAGDGKDTVDAGKGDDTVYGGNGDDVLLGGGGRDFLNGGRGSDTLEGGADDDILFGGASNNRLLGGAGDDRFYGAAERNILDKDGGDVVYAPQQDAGGKLGGSIRIAGTPEFKQRVEDDLEFMRSSPKGRQMLAAFDEAARNGNVLTIEENRTNAGMTTPGDDASTDLKQRNGVVTNNRGTDVTIGYNPSVNYQGYTPALVLYHEMSHAYNMVNGTRQSGVYGKSGKDRSTENSELQAVGIENSGKRYDFDNDPRTGKTTANPEALTENGLRREFGLPDRGPYSDTPSNRPPSPKEQPVPVSENRISRMPAPAGAGLSAEDATRIETIRELGGKSGIGEREIHALAAVAKENRIPADTITGVAKNGQTLWLATDQPGVRFAVDAGAVPSVADSIRQMRSQDQEPALAAATGDPVRAQTSAQRI